MYPWSPPYAGAFIYNDPPGGFPSAEFTSIDSFPIVASTYIETFLCTLPGTLHVSMYGKGDSQASIALSYKFGAHATWGQRVRMRETLVTVEPPVQAAGQVLAGAGSQTAVFTDTIKVPFSSGCRDAADDFSLEYIFGTAARQEGGRTTIGRMSLAPSIIGYPANWSPGDTTTVDALLLASSDTKGLGRGVYLGTATARYSMPMLLPGSGTELSRVLRENKKMITSGTTSPELYPYLPNVNLFATDNKQDTAYDHGGQLAYVFYGTALVPTSTDHANKLVLQISGGPTGTSGVGYLSTTIFNSAVAQRSTDLAGTAIDAFWLPGRPVMPSKK
jgi:hypothetical protein